MSSSQYSTMHGPSQNSKKIEKLFHPFAGVTIKRFSVSFLCTGSHEKEPETKIPEVVFVRITMLSVSPCGTLNRFAVHENKTENVLLSFL